ncbi:MAG: LCP family protein [Eubacteriales bacterium]|nr:LCP family protein [Eubacteriales bacterium]
MRKIYVICIALLLLFSSSVAEGITIELPSTKEQQENPYLVVPEGFSQDKNSGDKKDVYRLLILGIDSYDQRMLGRSDTMVIAQLDFSSGELKLVSFMRDLYMQIPTKGKNRLNAAYAFGGAELLKQTLDKHFNVNVDGYIAVNFEGMIKLIDGIGGIELEVLEDEKKPLNGILEYYNYLNDIDEAQGRLEEAGFVKLSGLQAMSFARIRKIDSDYERLSRQQRVLMAAFNKVRQLSPDKLLALIVENIDYVKTDISLNQAVNLANKLLSLESVTTRYLRIPVTKSFKNEMVNGAYYVVPNISKNRKHLSEFLGE